MAGFHQIKYQLIRRPESIAPLAFFRWLFGLMMCISALRFLANGWVRELYVDTTFHFKYWGFEWAEPLGDFSTHLLFVLIALTAFMVAIGLFYRASIISFFVLFTYAELMDATNYLNHYYFISIVAFLLIWLPAHRKYSIDAYRRPDRQLNEISAWMTNSLKLQIGLVYFFAGVAKINYDWLVLAEPLHHWLRAAYDFPILGNLFQQKATAYFFSWAGCLYDLSIPFLLMWRKSRPWAFAAVVFFHLITWALFPIGMFPFIMIGATIIFFPPKLHSGILNWISTRLENRSIRLADNGPFRSSTMGMPKFIPALFVVHFIIQMALPFRHLLYNSNLYWTEEGYRFSWRVMLTDKAGVAFYTVESDDGTKTLVNLCDYLSERQQKFLATNPDFMVQFAHHLKKDYSKKGYTHSKVYVESYLNLNGKGSRPFTNPRVDLASENWGLLPKNWILPQPKKS